MVKLLTGNRLHCGQVIWWKGDGWSTSFSHAVGLAPEDGEAIRQRVAADEMINDLALIDAEEVDGRLRPLRIRERIRSYGPTVRPDLAHAGQDYR